MTAKISRKQKAGKSPGEGREREENGQRIWIKKMVRKKGMPDERQIQKVEGMEIGLESELVQTNQNPLWKEKPFKRWRGRRENPRRKEKL